MPFGSNDVQITYEAVVRGAERLRDLSLRTRELTQATNQASTALARHAENGRKADGALRQASRSVRDFRRLIFPITAIVAAVSLAVADLARSSDSLAAEFQKMGDAIQEPKRRLAEFLATVIRGFNAMSGLQKLLALAPAGLLGFISGAAKAGRAIPASQTREATIQRLQLESEVLKLRGDEHGALLKKLEAEEVAFNHKIKNLADDQQAHMRRLFQERRTLLLEEQRLREVGIQTQAETLRSLRQDVVGAARGGIRGLMDVGPGKGPIGQQFGNVLKGVGEKIEKAIKDAVTERIVRALERRFQFSRLLDFLGGGTKAASRAMSEAKDQALLSLPGNIQAGNQIAARTNAATERIAALQNTAVQILGQIQACVCRVSSFAGGGGGGGITSGGFSLGGGGGGGFNWVGLARTIGSVAGMFFGGGFGGLGGLFGGGGGLPAGAGISLGSGASGSIFGGGSFGFFHKGGRVPSFQHGGEVPAFLEPGEFVVNRRAAAENRNVLEDINKGGRKKVRGTQNVFLIRANDSQSFVDMLSTPSSRAQIEVQLVRAIMSNSEIRKVIKDFTK